MKLIIFLFSVCISINLFAKGISEGGSQPHVSESERGNPVYDRGSSYDPTKAKNTYNNVGTKVKDANSQGEAIDVQLRNSAFNLANKSGKLREKASYYQKLGWATIGAGGSGAYFFWKARKYRKESSKTKKIAKDLYAQADKINDVDDGEFNAVLPEDSEWIDPSDIPDDIEFPEDLINDDNNKIAEKDFLNYLENEYGIKIEDDANGDTLITENGVTYSSDSPPELGPQALSLLSEADQKRIKQDGIVEEKGEEQKYTEKQAIPASSPEGRKVNSQDELYRAYIEKQKKQKPRAPTATAAGKVVLYNGEPIGHKYDNLFDMIHRAYDKATEQGLFYPPNTRLNPDGTPRK